MWDLVYKTALTAAICVPLFVPLLRWIANKI